MRYEVDVELKMRFLLAVEADDPSLASEKALAEMSERRPDEQTTIVKVEKGADRG